MVKDNDTLVCKRCGSINVETKAWLNANTAQFISWSENEEEDNWCDDCESICQLCTLGEFAEKCKAGGIA